MTQIEQAAHTLHETNLQLSRVLHELAGAASLCWVPRPEGVFDTQAALAQVERAISELRTPIRAALASLEAAKQEPLPKEPPLGLLVSMAIRADHALGVPGYYDDPLLKVANRLGHAQMLAATMSTMRQLYEEVSGHGFYKPEKEAEYAALAAAPSPGSGT